MSTFTVTSPVNIDSIVTLGAVAGLTWTRATTTATVTHTAHGLANNNIISVSASSSLSTIVLGVKTVNVVNANTYTFACLNAGTTSGTITAAPLDIININGAGYLTIDQHSRYGVNQSTSSVLGNITCSATLGGSLEINSTKVRLIPYDTGASTVPAAGTTISSGGASGSLIGVYSALNVAPSAAGDAMPATGFILIRQWNEVAFTTGALTGISASATSADVEGWLEIVGAEALTCTINRLNTFIALGDYFYFLGATTSGDRATTYQLPTNGSLTYCPGVEVETGVGTGVYEIYPNAASRPALLDSIATDEIRGRWCWVSTAGLVTFGNDGTNSTGGFLPEAGRRIRVYNIFLQNCTRDVLTDNALPSATIANRYEFATTGGGVINMDKVSSGWYLNFAQPYSVSLNNVATFDALILSECATPISWSRVSVGQSNTLSTAAFTSRLNFAGGTLDRCTWTRLNQAGSNNYIAVWTDCKGFTITNERNHTLLKGASTSTGSAQLNRVTGNTWTNTTLGGGQVWLNTCSLDYRNSTYYDHPATTTTSATGMYVYSVAAACEDCTFDGLDFGSLFMVQPYLGILSVLAAGCSNINLRNLGSAGTPLSLGAPRQDLVSWTRVTTTATLTSVGHGLKVGDIIYVPVTSVAAAIIVGAKTVTSVPTADTLTFTCLNSGATSGTLSYFPTVSANLIVIANGAAADTVKVQRCFVPNTRSGLYTADNSSTNIQFDNIVSDYVNAFTTPALNATHRSVSGSPTLAGQVSVYGTHWLDVFNADVTTNLADQNWTRVTTSCTVTSNDHKLRTGLRINVNVSSNMVGVPLGIKVVTVIDADTFTFSCVNSGTTSGTLTFRTVVDRLVVLMNETTAKTSSQVENNTGCTFTSTGGLVASTVDNTITFVQPYYALAITKFPIQELIMVGGTIANYRLDYQIDKNDGAGYSGWHNAYYPRPGGSGTSGQFTFTVTDATGVEIGDYVWGTGIGGNAQVTDIVSNTITVDSANSATVSGIIRFNHLPSETGFTDFGTKIKLRLTTIIDSTSAITSITIYCDTDDISRARLYPLEVVTVKVTARDAKTTALIPGARVFLKAAPGGPLPVDTVILNELTDALGVASDTEFDFSSDQPVAGRIAKSSESPLYSRTPLAGTITRNGLDITGFLVPDE